MVSAQNVGFNHRMFWSSNRGDRLILNLNFAGFQAYLESVYARGLVSCASSLQEHPSGSVINPDFFHQRLQDQLKGRLRG